MAKLTIKNLYKRYQNKNQKKKQTKQNDYAVNNLTLECEDGEFIALLGPSGCGKTTTLRMIAGLEDITAGEVIIGEKLVNDIQPRERNIGLAFEDYALYPPMSVYDNIAFNLKAKGVEKSEIDRRVKEIAPLMRVEELLDMRPVKLSGGQKQRVNIARAIVRRPALLLLDEPLSHLDGKMRQSLRTQIKRLHNEIMCTSVYVTHDQLEAMSLADRIAIMDFGVLQQFGTPEDVYDNPINEFVAGFIGEPPMNILETTISKGDGKFFFTFEESDFRIIVPERYYGVIKDGMKTKMGVRPMDVHIGAHLENTTDAKVAVFENLGDERHVGIRIGDTLLLIVTDDETRYDQGDSIKIQVDAQKTHLFDIDTGERIRA